MPEKLSVLRVQLDRAAKERLDELCLRRGMTQVSIMSRLIEWFVRQDQVVQGFSLGLLSGEWVKPLAIKRLEQHQQQQQQHQQHQQHQQQRKQAAR